MHKSYFKHISLTLNLKYREAIHELGRPHLWPRECLALKTLMEYYDKKTKCKINRLLHLLYCICILFIFTQTLQS